MRSDLTVDELNDALEDMRVSRKLSDAHWETRVDSLEHQLAAAKSQLAPLRDRLERTTAERNLARQVANDTHKELQSVRRELREMGERVNVWHTGTKGPDGQFLPRPADPVPRSPCPFPVYSVMEKAVMRCQWGEGHLGPCEPDRESVYPPLDEPQD